MAGGNTEQLIVSIQADLSDLRRQMASASGVMSETANSGKGSFGGLGSSIKGLMPIISGVIGAIGGVGLAMKGIQYNANLESSTVAWKTLLGTQEEAKTMMKDISKLAMNTQFDTTSVDQMAKYMHNAGFAGQELFDKVIQIADVSGAFNISADSAKEMARQMSQVQNAGVAMTEDLNILEDRSVPIMKTIAKQTGKTIAEVKKMASEGKITAAIYNSAWNEIATNFKGSADDQAKTFNGMLSSMQDSANIVLGQLFQPLFEDMKTVMPVILDLSSKFSEAMAKGGLKEVFKDVIPPEFAKNMESIGKVFDTVKTVIGDFLNFLDKDGNMQAKLQIFSHFDAGSGKALIDTFTNAKTVIDNFSTVVQSIWDVATGFFEFMANPGSVDAFTGIFNNFDADTANILVQTFTNIKVAIQDFFTVASDIFGKLGAVWADLSTQALPVFDKLGKVFAVCSGIVAKELPIIWDFVKFLMDKIITIVKPILSDMLTFISGILTQVLKFWDENGSDILKSVQNIFNGIKVVIDVLMPLIQVTIGAAWNIIKVIFQGALDIIMGAVKIFSGLFTGNWDKVWAGVKQIFSGALSIIQGIWDNTWGMLLSFIRSFATSIVAYISNGFSSMFSSISNWMASIWSKITSTFYALLGMAISWGVGLITGFVNGIASMFGAISSKSSQVVSSVVDAISNKASSLYNVAVNFIQGFINGMADKIGDVVRKATDLAKKAYEAVTGFFQQKSPSRLMRKVGVFFGAGLELGIGDSESGVVDTAEGLAKSAVAPFDNLSAMANINFGVNKLDMNTALNNAGITSNALIKAQAEKEMKVELTLKGGIDKLADLIEARVVTKLNSSIGGSL